MYITNVAYLYQEQTFDQNESILLNRCKQRIREGKNLESSINTLKTLLEKDSKNYSLNYLIACAYTNRAASIAFATRKAASFQESVVKYKSYLSTWEEAQKDPKNPFYGAVKPEEPTLTTKDDQKIFTLTPEEGERYYNLLIKKALKHIEQAITNAKSQDNISESTLCKNWVLLINKSYYTEFKFVKTTDIPFNTEQEILTSFEALSENSNNSKLLENTGNAYIALGKFNDKKILSLALSAFQKAFEINSHSISSAYRISEIKSILKPDSTEDLSTTLRACIDYDQSNGFLWCRYIAEKCNTINNKKNITKNDINEINNDLNGALNTNHYDYPDLYSTMPIYLTYAWKYFQKSEAIGKIGISNVRSEAFIFDFLKKIEDLNPENSSLKYNTYSKILKLGLNIDNFILSDKIGSQYWSSSLHTACYYITCNSQKEILRLCKEEEKPKQSEYLNSLQKLMKHRREIISSGITLKSEEF